MYVGEDEKLHFTDSEGADTALPFKLGKIIAVTVENKKDLNSAWSVDIGMPAKSFAWYCPTIDGISYECAGICNGNIKRYITSSNNQLGGLNYEISGNMIKFPYTNGSTFKNGAIVYFFVI